MKKKLSIRTSEDKQNIYNSKERLSTTSVEL